MSYFAFKASSLDLFILIKYPTMRKILAFITLILVASTFRIGHEVGDIVDCIKEKCPTQYAACTKDPKCMPALQDCQKKCGSSTSCWEFCLPGKGSQAAIDTAKCAHAQGCDKVEQSSTISAKNVEDPTDCIKEKCPTQYAAC